MIFAVFGNSYISDYIGYTMRTTVAFTLLLIYCIFKLSKGEYSHKLDKSYYLFLWTGILIYLFHVILKHDYFQSMLTMVYLPCIFYVFFLKFNNKEKKIVQVSLLIFFITNCIMAIWEHYHVAYFIPHEISRMDLAESWTFRARAMLGHPLANALIMSTMIVYILASDLDFKIKMLLFLLGEYALLCFNARSGILCTTCCSLPIIFKNIKLQKKSTRKYYFLIIFSFFVYATYYVLNSDIGGRLVNLSSNQGFLNDSSSLARLEILDFVNYISLQDFLYGNPDGYERILVVMNLMGVENGFVTIVLYYGIIGGVLLFVFMNKFYWNNMKKLGMLERSCIFICYWGIGFTNPHIAYSLAWYYFFFDYFAFTPNRIKTSK